MGINTAKEIIQEAIYSGDIINVDETTEQLDVITSGTKNTAKEIIQEAINSGDIINVDETK